MVADDRPHANSISGAHASRTDGRIGFALALLLRRATCPITGGKYLETKDRLPPWVNKMVYVSCALGLLGFLLMMGGILSGIGGPALAISSWLGAAMFTVGLALFLCFLVGMSVAMYQLRRLF
jgi:hypothetical protein